MPRQITDLAINAFMNGKNFKQKNTTVGNIDTVTTDLYLHGNLIARRNKETGQISVTNAGWQSNTTKERLNAIPGVSVYQKQRKWYLNGELWDGSWKTILQLVNVNFT